LDDGFESADLYYNLGNACFKTDDLASAILYYEKALKLSPNDEDIVFNLNVANSRITDKIEPLPVMFYKRWWIKLSDLFSTDAWAKIQVVTFLLMLFALGGFLILRRVIVRKVSFWLALLFFIATIFSFGITYQKYTAYQKHTEAIVFTPSLTVKISPTENSVDLFVVHEGTKVKILDQLDGWYEVKIASGSSGWIQNESVKKI